MSKNVKIAFNFLLDFKSRCFLDQTYLIDSKRFEKERPFSLLSKLDIWHQNLGNTIDFVPIEERNVKDKWTKITNT